MPVRDNIQLLKLRRKDGGGRTVTLGKKFTKDENAKIVAFLKTLTGDQPNFQLPILPPSSDTTPRPQPFGK